MADGQDCVPRRCRRPHGDGPQASLNERYSFMSLVQVLKRKNLAVVSFLLLAVAAPLSARQRPGRALFAQFESSKPYTGKSQSRIDVLVAETLRRQGIAPANPCSDGVFIRRVYLDVVGRLPEPQEVRRFLQSRLPRKRAVLIDGLLQQDAFADYWSLKWCDVLRVKAEFPINLWPNAVQAYHRWIHDALRDNMPYDQFARELLTASGSNFRVPQVNFYRAVQGQEPTAIAAAATLTFMGVRFDQWPESRRRGMEVFFSRVAYKTTAEWKEEIVYLDPAPADPLMATFPDGSKYVGQFQGGKINGQGILTLSDGTTIEGTWKDGKLVEPKTVDKSPIPVEH